MSPTKFWTKERHSLVCLHLKRVLLQAKDGVRTMGWFWYCEPWGRMFILHLFSFHSWVYVFQCLCVAYADVFEHITALSGVTQNHKNNGFWGNPEHRNNRKVTNAEQKLEATLSGNSEVCLGVCVVCMVSLHLHKPFRIGLFFLFV